MVALRGARLLTRPPGAFPGLLPSFRRDVGGWGKDMMTTTQPIVSAGGYRKTDPWQEAFDSSCFLESDLEILSRKAPSPLVTEALEMSRRILMLLRQERASQIPGGGR